jgi:hypothetical protein
MSTCRTNKMTCIKDDMGFFMKHADKFIKLFTKGNIDAH